MYIIVSFQKMYTYLCPFSKWADTSMKWGGSMQWAPNYDVCPQYIAEMISRATSGQENRLVSPSRDINSPMNRCIYCQVIINTFIVMFSFVWVSVWVTSVGVRIIKKNCNKACIMVGMIHNMVRFSYHRDTRVRVIEFWKK